MSAFEGFRLFCAAVRELLLPTRATCLGCGSRLGANANFLCAECLAKLVPLYKKNLPVCPRCGTEGGGLPRCGLCADWPPLYPSKARYAYHYEPPIEGLVRALKYDGVYRLAPFLGAQIYEMIRATDFHKPDFVIPVPMHRARLLERGFNQAELLAEVVARSMGVPLRKDLLSRVRNTPQQARLRGEARRRNLKDAFTATCGVYAKRILLIDDVLTTGETILRCADALRKAGAWDVQVATLSGPRPARGAPIAAFPYHKQFSARRGKR